MYHNLKEMFLSSAWLCQQHSGNWNLSVCVAIIPVPNVRISFKLWLLVLLNYTQWQFLAMLDYVSRAHEIEICPSIRLWHQLSLNLLCGFLSKFGCCFPWAICPEVFWIFERKMIFGFLWIFFVFVNIGLYGSKNFKTLLLPQITFESFQTFSEISSQLSTLKECFGFLKFLVYDFSRFFFSFSSTWDPNGSKNFKTLLLPQITFEFFQTFSEIYSQLYWFGFLKFWVRFFTILFPFR